MTPIESIDFAAMEEDVDEDGLIDPLHDVETRYARLTSARTTESFAEFLGDYEDCYIAIRVPFTVLQDMLDHHSKKGGMMAEQFLPCPGCRGEPFVDQPRDEPRRYLECNECTFRAEDRDWQRRTAPPATKAMLDAFRGRETQDVFYNDIQSQQLIRAFLAEWPEPDAKGGA